METLETRKIVFLDRDGTINVDYGYITKPEQIELFNGAAKAIGDLTRSGFLVVIISNQSAIGRGYATWEDIHATNARLQDLLLREDADACLAMVLCSPDAPWDSSLTRKPEIGLVDEVRRSWRFVEFDCWMVGDKVSDVEFGMNLGLPSAHCIRIVAQGAATEEIRQYPIAANLVEAARMILSGG